MVIDCILYISNGKVSHLVQIVYWYAGCVKCFEKVYMVLNQVWKWLEKTVMVSLSEACHLSLLSLGLNRVRICITPHTYFVAWSHEDVYSHKHLHLFHKCIAQGCIWRGIEVGVFHQISKNVGYLYGLVVLIFKY